MPLSQLNTNSFGPLAITTSQIANNAVTNVQIANNTVTNVQVANNTIGSSQLANLTTLPTSGGNITLPAVTGTAMVSGNMPAFSAYANTNQTTSASYVATKVQINTKEFDTNNNFDATTNYRFTPTVAGYYQITGAIRPAGTGNDIFVSVYKNGSLYKVGNEILSNNSVSLTVTCLVYCNGSTDYIELYSTSSAAATLAGTSYGTYFQGVLVRSA